MLSFLASTLFSLVIFGWVVLPLLGLLIRAMEKAAEFFVAVGPRLQPRIARTAPHPTRRVEWKG